MTREELNSQLEDYGTSYQEYQEGRSISDTLWMKTAADKMLEIEDALLAAYDAQAARIKELEERVAAFEAKAWRDELRAAICQSRIG
jgi:polyhydroxyalkanoate synthesis regulator phasin